MAKALGAALLSIFLSLSVHATFHDVHSSRIASVLSACRSSGADIACGNRQSGL
jgi:hypothetical protein